MTGQARFRPGKRIRRVYGVLDAYFGDLGWWPAESAFEVIVGAILTQNTSWRNVERSVMELKARRLMCPERMVSAGTSALEKAVRSSGYYRAKTESLKAVSKFLMREHGGDLTAMSGIDTGTLRRRLLDIRGIGPETADSILLYAFNRSVFVVDAYARRIFSRHGILEEDAAYTDIQKFVSENFTRGKRDLKQFHALLVETGKRFCRKKTPLCGQCPLRADIEKKRGKKHGEY